MIEAITRDMGNWLLVTSDFKGLSMADFVCDWWTSINCSHSITQNQQSLNWCPPLAGLWKLNCDGALKGNPSPIGFGCVIQDHNGIISRILYGPLEPCNSTKAETMTMLLGLRELKKMGLFECIVEGDSAVVIGWGQSKECKSWRMWNLM